MHTELPKWLACKNQNIIIIIINWLYEWMLGSSAGVTSGMYADFTNWAKYDILDSKEFLYTHFNFSLQQLRVGALAKVYSLPEKILLESYIYWKDTKLKVLTVLKTKFISCSNEVNYFFVVIIKLCLYQCYHYNFKWYM